MGQHFEIIFLHDEMFCKTEHVKCAASLVGIKINVKKMIIQCHNKLIDTPTMTQYLGQLFHPSQENALVQHPIAYDIRKVF